MASQLTFPPRSFLAVFPSITLGEGLAPMDSVTWITGQHFLAHPQLTNTPQMDLIPHPGCIWGAEEELGMGKEELSP